MDKKNKNKGTLTPIEGAKKPALAKASLTQNGETTPLPGLPQSMSALPKKKEIPIGTLVRLNDGQKERLLAINKIQVARKVNFADAVLAAIEQYKEVMAADGLMEGVLEQVSQELALPSDNAERWELQKDCSGFKRIG